MSPSTRWTKTRDEERLGAEKGDTLKEFASMLDEPALRSTARLLILASLALNCRMGFTSLLQLTGLGKGSLSAHLDQLEKAGFLRLRRVLTIAGPKVVAEIAPKGLEAYEKYIRALEKLSSAKQ
jgi:DNA-binding MarR family transcriptional regulator